MEKIIRRSKEQIIEHSLYHKHPEAEYITESIAEELMDEFAKQEAVEFAEWRIKNNWSYVIEGLQQEIKWTKGSHSPHLSTTELYQLFLNPTQSTTHE
jgi:hypothetical protein